MYLLTFVALLIGIIGIYAQVIAVQAGRQASQLTGIAPALLTWHSAAVSMAQSILKTNLANYTATMQASGCSLTFSAPTGIATCPSPFKSGVAIDATGTVTNGASPPAPNLIYNSTTTYNACVNLPSYCSTPSPLPPSTDCGGCTATYDTNNYQFHSVLYMSGTQNYIVTFVPPPTISATNPAPGYITAVPSGEQLSVTISDLLRQLNNTGAPNYSYGYIVSDGATMTTLHTGGICSGGPCVYTLPATFNSLSLNGGVAIIGTP